MDCASIANWTSNTDIALPPASAPAIRSKAKDKTHLLKHMTQHALQRATDRKVKVKDICDKEAVEEAVEEAAAAAFDLQQMSHKQLQTLCREKGLPVKGSKDVLRQRLLRVV